MTPPPAANKAKARAEKPSKRTVAQRDAAPDGSPMAANPPAHYPFITMDAHGPELGSGPSSNSTPITNGLEFRG
eukprot:CAMPEP_0202394456 /NCGR_PEP_ID=MMETSP1127-20130417/93441_1 /ASSEMBLY_ACC=CAM_ASM_000462 /TAXON_ID=3047 /ORGANISM="Dunaliella tertiolecta, Strain CCMP1320" /LENGTH=73 /DNA_ID=CAMNT_0048997079 /DNA_START=438 /DNA_END=659 /DNA_ORIENTATION=-